MTRRTCEIHAAKRAREDGTPYAVIEYDSADRRKMAVVRESYLDEPEFGASDGRLLTLVQPTGEEERCR